MASDIYKELGEKQFNINAFMSDLNELKSKGGDPNQMIDGLVRSGKVTQAQVNAAMSKAQMIMRLMGR